MSDSEQRMQVLQYRVKFLTPAFLGNAEQAGQWRTPPFKALLRQWWRVAVARDFDYDASKIRCSEALLFGHAWLEGDRDRKGKSVAARASMLRLRLGRWDIGKETKEHWRQKETGPNDRINHPEVQQPIGPLLYLGYGPLTAGRNHPHPTLLKSTAAIQAGEEAELAVAAPSDHLDSIRSAFSMMSAYGTLGGRSRNGWGSVRFSIEEATVPRGRQVSKPRQWVDALQLDWPHAIGWDARGPLIWQTRESFMDWRSAMGELAKLKVGLRTQFKFSAGPPHHQPLERHWLSYPVTRHAVQDWRNLRLPNSLRFKVRPDAKDAGKLRGLMFHMPCRPPSSFRPRDHGRTIQGVWQKVHHYLDGVQPVQRVNQ